MKGRNVSPFRQLGLKYTDKKIYCVQHIPNMNKVQTIWKFCEPSTPGSNKPYAISLLYPHPDWNQQQQYSEEKVTKVSSTVKLSIYLVSKARLFGSSKNVLTSCELFHVFYNSCNHYKEFALSKNSVFYQLIWVKIVYFISQALFFNTVDS